MEKYNSGKGFNGRAGNYVANIFPVEVKHIGKLTITNQELENFTDETGAPLTSDNIRIIKKSLERYNSDEHAIKVAINGSKFDGDVEDGVYTKKKLAQLPNCFPLLPKHINFVPKIGEMVLVMVESAEDVFNDRYYVGPLTSSLTKMDKDLSSTALSNRSYGITEATEEISKIPLAKGIYENPQNVIIEGRNNTDIIQRNEEILLRAGKFVTNNPLLFNDKSPGYIQIKSNFSYDKESDKYFTGPPSPNGNTTPITVTNIVSDKINLLTYNGSPNLSEKNGLTNVNKKTNVAEYINDDKLEDILNHAHPLVFGDKLIEYLKLLRSALLNHVHNGSGNPATDMPPNSISVETFENQAEKLENAMLSKNIRIN